MDLYKKVIMKGETSLLEYELSQTYTNRQPLIDGNYAKEKWTGRIRLNGKLLVLYHGVVILVIRPDGEKVVEFVIADEKCFN